MLRAAARTRRRRRAARTVLRAAAPILPRRPAPEDPIFLLGSPRSGTSLVFELLKRSAAVASLDNESHLLWDLCHDLADGGFTSHALGAGDVAPRERRVLYWAVGRLASGRRYLDKAPRNSLRVPYLAELFPTARFVHVQRDGRAAVSSLITGWRDRTGMFPAFALPVPLAVTGYAGTGWHFILPPGWRAYAEGRTLAEVCAFQWTSANEAILDARDRLGGDRWLQVRYEDLVEHPEAEAAALLEGLGLPVDERVLAFARDLDRHHTRTVTAPERDKWRRENPEEIGTILGQIEPTMRRLGYPVDPVIR